MNIALDNGAFKPRRAHPTDAGYDLYSPIDIVVPPVIGEAFIDTGVHVQPPHGFYLAVKGRSGMAINHGLLVFEGTIDEGYRGSIGVLIYNLSAVPYTIKRGDKIAQFVIQSCEYLDLNVVDALEESDRGSDGFGSTGK